MRVIVDEIHDLTEKVRAFTLRPDTGTGLPPFSAGSHIAITVTLPGGVTAKRKYSILSSPAQSSCYGIAVLQEPDGTGGSRYMHTQVQVGQSLDISEPRQFPLSITGSHHILLAGGIGITPPEPRLTTYTRKECSPWQSDLSPWRISARISKPEPGSMPAGLRAFMTLYVTWLMQVVFLAMHFATKALAYTRRVMRNVTPGLYLRLADTKRQNRVCYLGKWGG